jgi:hypothetical protein
MVSGSDVTDLACRGIPIGVRGGLLLDELAAAAVLMGICCQTGKEWEVQDCLQAVHQGQREDLKVMVRSNSSISIRRQQRGSGRGHVQNKFFNRRRTLSTVWS